MMQTLFDEIFLSTDMWGYFGVLALVIVGVFVTRKEKGLGIFFIIVDSLIIWQYLQLITATPAYWWNVFILLFGVILCLTKMI